MKWKQIQVKTCIAVLAMPLSLAITTHVSAANVVGKTEFARGAAAAKLAEQAPRILGKDSDVFLRDVVQTGPSSFAIIGFVDAAKVTVRPNSKLTVTEYLNDYAELGLHKGGIRGASGAIARTLPGQFKIETPVATVEIHNAKFDVRYCENDCANEENSMDPVEKPELAEVVGRVAALRGTANSTNPNGDTRKLGLGAPLHERDVIETGGDSYALLMFRDSSKVTLEANTEFHIEAQKYFEGNPEKNEAVYRFMRGGMRALTGAIGNDSADKYQVSTPVATTGIRGTGFDLACRGNCISQRIQGSPEFISAAIPDGLYSLVWEGSIHQDNDAGRFDLSLGKAGYIANRQNPLIRLPAIPSFMDRNPAPRPDTDNTSLEQLFGTTAVNGVPPGLYVHVRSGHVRITTVDGRTLDIGTGEIGYAGRLDDRGADAAPGADVPAGRNPDDAIPGTTLPASPEGQIAWVDGGKDQKPDPKDIQLFRLDSPRAFLINDPYPKPESADLNKDLFTLLDDEDLSRRQFFECICPL